MNGVETNLPNTGRRRLWIRALLLGVGVALLGAFVYAAGPAEIAANLSRLGWGFFALVALNAVWRSIAATAMWTLFDPEHGLSLARIMTIRWTGESINTLTPFGNVGGEPVKAVMLARELGGTGSAGFILLDKTIFSLASVGFMVTGGLFGVAVLAQRPMVFALSIALLIPWLLVLGWTITRQVKGDFVVKSSGALKLLRIRLKPKTLARLEEVDATMSRFWRERRARFVTAFTLHALARGLRVVDVWLCVTLLGAHITIGGAYLTAAIGMLASTTFFFIPNGIGVAEGGQGYVLELLGPGVAVGVSMALARRVRNYVVSGVAYLVLVAWPARETHPK